MAKIDVTQIDGYENMSAEEKIKALEGFDIPNTDYTGWIKKDMYDKVASDLAKAKKELREKMTDDEKKKEEQEELENKYKLLLRESEITKNKSKLIAMGYEESLADETAIAMMDGDTEKVFINQKKHIESVEKKAREEALKNTPRPKGGSGDDVMTIDKFRMLSPQERYEFSVKHPDEYKQLYTTGG